MPIEEDFNGLDTYRELRSNRHEQKVLISSGYSETERVRGALTLGVGGYLGKPFTIEKLGEAVRAVFDSGTYDPKTT